MAEAVQMCASGTARDQRGKRNLEQFRLRRSVESLISAGEVHVHDEAIALAELAPHLDDNEKAVLFRAAGPEQAEVVGNVMGSRGRLAAAFGVDESAMLEELLKRLETPQPIVEVESADAPVHQIVLEGEAADLTRLPVPFQHRLDGGPYISAAIDFVDNPAAGLTNVGVRRLMLRGRREAGVDLNAPSNLRAIYQAAVARGEQTPVSLVVGAHPLDYLAATMRLPVDETAILGSLRAAPLPVVRCRTNGIRVPADAKSCWRARLTHANSSRARVPTASFYGSMGC